MPSDPHARFHRMSALLTGPVGGTGHYHAESALVGILMSL